jgi:uncharacterized GH25 family protein
VKRTFLRAGLFVVLFGLLGIFASAQNGPVPVGTLAGTVLDAHGKPVADATVTIQTSDGLHPHATHTDSDGHFEFARWATGQYDVRAYSNGLFSDWDKRLMIRRKKTTQVTLHLPADSDKK